jgi:nucleotide-binding universal stress UspA family protein
LSEIRKKETHIKKQMKTEVDRTIINGIGKRLFDRIIVIIDGSELAERTVVTGISIAKSFNIGMTVMYVLDTSVIVRAFPHHDRVISPQHLEMAVNLKKEARSFLDDIESMCDKFGLKVTTKLAENIPFVEIVKKAERKDLIVIGCRLSSSYRRFLRNDSGKILRHTSSTVMFVR